jgi:hypothetical protein
VCWSYSLYTPDMSRYRGYTLGSRCRWSFPHRRGWSTAFSLRTPRCRCRAFAARSCPTNPISRSSSERYGHEACPPLFPSTETHSTTNTRMPAGDCRGRSRGTERAAQFLYLGLCGGPVAAEAVHAYPGPHHGQAWLQGDPRPIGVRTTPPLPVELRGDY